MTSDSGHKPADGKQQGPDYDKLRGQARTAVKTAGGAMRTGAGIVRRMMPKKWTWKKALIAIGILVVLFIVFRVLFETIWWILSTGVVIALIGGGLWLIFGPGGRK